MTGVLSYLVKLSDRRLFLLEGTDTVKFLNGLCTQNIPAFAQTPLLSTPALFLNPRGRVLFESIVTKIPHFESQDPAFYIDVHKKQASCFQTHIEKYRFKNDIVLHDLTDLMQIYALFSEQSCPEGEEGSVQKLMEVDVPEETKGEEGQGYMSFIDPRTIMMGTRTICVGEALEVEDQQDVLIGTQEHYDVFRCIQGVPEGPCVSGHIPHFLNFQYLRAIANDKGCYIGQELVARTYTQGQVRRVLLPYCFLHQNYLDEKGRLKVFGLKDFMQSPEVELTGKKVIDETGKEAGVIIHSVKSVGLAAINLDQIGGMKYNLEGGGGLAFWKPAWLEKQLHKE